MLLVLLPKDFKSTSTRDLPNATEKFRMEILLPCTTQVLLMHQVQLALPVRSLIQAETVEEPLTSLLDKVVLFKAGRRALLTSVKEPK